MKKLITKLATRKDIRDKMLEEQARELFLQANSKFNTPEEIELEIRKIYDSSFESLLDEDSRGVLLFDKSSTLL